MEEKRTHPGCGDLALLLDWLGGDDTQKIAVAVACLCRSGPAVVEFLLLEAVNPSTDLLHQYRLLSLAGKIGGQRGPAENRHLRELQKHWCPAIRKKAAEVFAVLVPVATPRRPKGRSRLPNPDELIRAMFATDHTWAAARKPARKAKPKRKSSPLGT